MRILRGSRVGFRPIVILESRVGEVERSVGLREGCAGVRPIGILGGTGEHWGAARGSGRWEFRVRAIVCMIIRAGSGR